MSEFRRTALLGFWLTMASQMGAHPSFARAQEPLPPLDDHHVRIFTVADGLMASDVRSVAEGPEGYLYVGFGAGIMRFDGHEFRVVPTAGFTSGFFDGLYRDPAGRLWIWNRAGELGLLGDGVVQALPSPPAPIIGLPMTTSDRIWLGSTRGLLRFDPGSGTYSVLDRRDGLPSDTVKGVVETGGGEQMVVTAAGLARMEVDPDAPSAPRFLPIEPGFRPVIPENVAIPSAHPDRSGLWIRADSGVVRYVERRSGRQEASPGPDRAAPRSTRLRQVAWQDLAPSTSGTPIPDWLAHLLPLPPEVAERFGEQAYLLPLIGRDGSRWLRVLIDRSAPPWLLVQRRGEFEEIPLSEFPDTSRFNVLYEDREGSLWIGTPGGLVQLFPRRVAGLTEGPRLEEAFTTAVLQSRDGAVWVGTWGGGLHRYRRGALSARYTTEDGLAADRVRSLFESTDGTLWVGGNRGFAALGGSGGSKSSPDRGPTGEGPPAVIRSWYRAASDEIGAFAETVGPDGVPMIWVAAGADLLVARRPPGGWGEAEFVPFRAGFDWGSLISVLLVTGDGSLWVGGTGGVFEIRGDQVRHFGLEDGLRSEHIVSFHRAEGDALWIGTYAHGLHRYRSGRIVAVTTREGLHSDGIWDMLPDEHGFLWMSSDAGVARVDRELLDRVADALEKGLPPQEFLDPLVFTEREGMPSRENNRAFPGGWRLEDGRMVFNNIAGLVVIDPEQALRSPPPPPTRLRGVRVDGREVMPSPELPRGGAAARTASAVAAWFRPDAKSSEVSRFPPGARHITFEYSALSFITPEQNRYRYRLDGYDDEWMEGGTQRQTHYTGLPPGRYVFRVQGATGTGPWSEDGASYAFVVPPLLWQTWWFRALLLSGLFGVLLIAYRWRVSRLLEMERLRMRIALDLHDDVGSSLSSIALLAEMLQDRARLARLERRQLRRISEAAGDTIASLREIIWLVDPTHDNLRDLIQRMRHTARDLLNGIAVTFDAPDAPEARPLDPVFLRQTFLIYKEALHNVVKHAGARHVRVEVCADRGHLVMRIEDDGSGFREGEVVRGHGLDSMRRRAEELGGRLTVESGSGGGTRITFRARMP